ncbi:uncharacterized protein N7477_008540 [Penicillium maclennaniae]|uniref:uncharacterized protein n=1 Tax=Penicillium maclennaniae TaxID=1343394 RepID=UPI00253FC5CB|nr:uncharacterized protein N7477_008540 [Penicillium maclennaniae]KAJ5666092.1 hypothetical protein N7477_008540 [Penicillium maclennaniae]
MVGSFLDDIGLRYADAALEHSERDHFDRVPPHFDDIYDYRDHLAILSNVYLLSLQYKTTTSPLATAPAQVSTAIVQAIHNVSQTGNGTTLEVRAGYMGLCVALRDTERICSRNARVLANLIKAEKFSIRTGNTSTEFTPDPLNLIMIANEFKEKIVFDGLMQVLLFGNSCYNVLIYWIYRFIVVILTFICFILLSTFPGWHKEVDETGSEIETKPFPSDHVIAACLFTTCIGFGFGLISILWQHINSSSTASMAETLTYGAATGHVGGVAMALGWIAVGVIALVGLGLLEMKLSIDLLKRLIDVNTTDGSSA